VRTLAALVVSLTLPLGGIRWWGLTAASTPVGQFANTSLWTTSMTVSQGKVFVLVGRKLS
jgi:hypothetical protein